MLSRECLLPSSKMTQCGALPAGARRTPPLCALSLRRAERGAPLQSGAGECAARSQPPAPCLQVREDCCVPSKREITRRVWQPERPPLCPAAGILAAELQRGAPVGVAAPVVPPWPSSGVRSRVNTRRTGLCRGALRACLRMRSTNASSAGCPGSGKFDLQRSFVFLLQPTSWVSAGCGLVLAWDAFLTWLQWLPMQL